MSGTESRETLLASGSERLATLARGLGFDEPSTGSMREVFHTLAASWRELPAGGAPPWPSDVCDDHSPYALSMAVDSEGPQVRVLVEPMDAPSSLEANRTASLRLHEALARNFGIRFDRVRALEDLLLPEEARGRFVAWYSAVFSPGQPLDFKAYFNLQVQGPGRAPMLAHEALHRLGFHDAWPTVAGILGLREAGADELAYLALDLSSRFDARVKLSFRHHQATAAFLDTLGGVARHHQPGGIARFCRSMTGGNAGPYGGKGVVTCFSFTAPSDTRPKAMTVYFPVSHHARDDREIRQRITDYLHDQGLPSAHYLGALEGCARRPLEAGVGIHTYAAMRWQERPRVTVYFSPEQYGRRQPPHCLATAAQG